MAYIASWKKDEVSELKELLESYPVIGIVDISGIAAKQLQIMRREFHDSIVIRAARNTLLKVALESSDKEEIQKLSEYVQSGSSIALTTINPFLMYKKFEKGKTNAPAKGGEISPKDIVIQKGDTGFPPGPLVGEMQRIGIPAAIEKGKIVVKKDHVLLKTGDVILPEVAAILNKLEIEPLEVGLNLFAACEEGFVFTTKDLEIDEELVKCQYGQAYANAFNLAINAAIPIAETIEILLALAYSNTRNLSVNAAIVNEVSLPVLIAKGYAEMLSLARAVGKDALDDELIASTCAVTAAPVIDNSSKEESSNEEEPKDEGPSEEDTMGGLGSLFG